MANEDRADFDLVMSYWIDTDGYSDRDRLMFVCGAEFTMVHALVEGGWKGSRAIHRENESRLRMMCGRLNVPCEIGRIEGHDSWSTLTVK